MASRKKKKENYISYFRRCPHSWFRNDSWLVIVSGGSIPCNNGAGKSDGSPIYAFNVSDVKVFLASVGRSQVAAGLSVSPVFSHVTAIINRGTLAYMEAFQIFPAAPGK